MQITVTITGLDRVEERLSALGDSLHDFSDTLKGLGKALILFYGDTVFVSRGQALGSTWAPLSTTYDAWKAKNYEGRGILERTGIMRESFYSEVTPATLFVGNSAPYFSYHQNGTGAGGADQAQIAFGRAMLGIGGGTRVGRGNNLPARPMIGVNSRVESLINVAVKADIKAKIESIMA